MSRKILSIVSIAILSVVSVSMMLYLRTPSTRSTGTESELEMITYHSQNDTEGQFTFMYPNDWRIVYQTTGDPRVGLAPADLAEEWEASGNASTGILIVRLFRNVTNLETLAKDYHGVGDVMNSITIGSYLAYYIEAENDGSVFRSYTILNDSDALDIFFQQRDNSRGLSLDYSEYLSDVELIVNSVEFL